MAERSRTLSFGGWANERPSSVITTFYSFKGGVGRTQSLFNVAARLAAVRRNVMMVDVDLEAPGLSIGVLNEEERQSKEGFADIAYDLLIDLRIAFEKSKDVHYLSVIRARYIARIRRALHKVRLPRGLAKGDLARRLTSELNATVPNDGALYVLSTGRVGEDYTQNIAQLPLAKAYKHKLKEPNRETVRELVEEFEAPVDPERLRTLGHVFAAMLRETMHAVKIPRREEAFDHVLVDSRSGLADVGGLCLLGLAETRVVLTGLNEQNVTGTKMVLDDIAKVDDDARNDRHLIVVFSPVPEGELDLLARRLDEAKKTLEVSDKQVRLLHYHPRIALSEKAFADPIHRHTRIYQEYEDLTDHLLNLTGSDAHTLVSHALDEFREAGDDDDRYQDLVNRLIRAVFLEEAHVASVVDGLCTQLERAKPDENALPLFDLWVALLPDKVRVLGTTANYHNKIAQSPDRSTETRKKYLQRSFELNRRIIDADPLEHRAWMNWGTGLCDLARLVAGSDSSRAEGLYHEAFEKYGRAVDIKPDKHQAWYNWGTDLSNLARLVSGSDSARAEEVYREAFEKYERAVDIKPDKHEAWHNWGIGLGNLAGFVAGSDSSRAEGLYQEAFEKYERAVDIKPDKHQAWYNWGTDLSNLARLVSGSDSSRAEEVYREAFEKYERAVDIKPDKHEAWHNWGTDLVKCYLLLETDERESSRFISEALSKLYRSIEIQDEHPDTHFSIVVALAERGEDGDIDAAANHLRMYLDADPQHIYVIERSEYTDIIRAHSELRDILDAYKAKVDVDEEDLEDADRPDEPGQADLDLLSG